jgi:hypothetical protein
MTKPRWIALGLIVALLFGLQHFGLERTAETIAEAPLKRVPNLPASTVLPTYVATLFFGAFRAVAVDMLWIQLRKVKEEKRWYEMKEVTRFISYVQPRNPEVWSHLAWDSAYNIANGFTDKEEAWKWVKFGLLWLRQGLTTLPNEPYLKHQLAYTLWHKIAWRDGELDYDLLKRIEGDAELQAALPPDGMKSDRRLSPFELAIPWLDLARDELMDKEFQITQMGLVIYPETMDGFSRYCMVLQGMYDWQSNRHEKAKEWFRRARKQVEDMIARTPEAPKAPGFEKKYRNSLSPIFPDWVKLYARYPDLVDLELKARGGRLEDQRALLELLQGLLVQYGPIDEQWLWTRYNPHVMLNALKMKLAKGEDTLECNDSFEMASDFSEGSLAAANLAPEGLDVDFYALSLLPPPEARPPLRTPPRPMTATLTFKRPATAKLDLKMTFYDPNRRVLLEQVLDPSALVTPKGLEIKVQAAEYGRYFVKIEAANPAPPWPEDTRYRFQYSVER